jgi:hypothetical protein
MIESTLAVAGEHRCGARIAAKSMTHRRAWHDIRRESRRAASTRK